MRWLFYLLLLANLALFAAMQYLHLGEDVKPEIPARAGGITLKTLSELPANELQLRKPDALTPAAESRAPSPPVDTITSTPPPETEHAPEPRSAAVKATPTDVKGTSSKPAVCYRVTGLESKVALANLTGLLEEGGASVYSRGQEKGERTSYWVMLPPAASRSVAMKEISRLKSRRIKDYYLVRDGENENAISLGVFRGEQSARRRYQQIRALGFRPNLEQIQLPESHYWLGFRLTDPNKIHGLEKIIEKTGGYKGVVVDCP
jgi:hypothetical protein